MAGPDDSSAERKPSVTVWMENLTKIAAVLGAFVAVGQAGSEAIRGYWQRESDRAKATQELALTQAKATQELALTRVKESSKLAQDYIQLLMNKDVAPPDRIMLLGALSEIKDHPLQTWAQKRYDAIMQNLDAINRARDEQIRALGERNDKEREARILEARIAEANEQANGAANDIVQSGKYKEQVRVLSEQLAKLKGEIGVVVANDRASQITSLIAKIDTKMLLTVFPPSAEENINKYLPFIKAAMQEFQISEKRVAAAMLATIHLEAGQFSPAVTAGSDRFRGRGFILLSGEQNYVRMSERLRLGTRLVDSPDDAVSPEVAARALCAFFADWLTLQPLFADAGGQAFFQLVMRRRNTTPDEAARFNQTFEKLLAQL